MKIVPGKLRERVRKGEVGPREVLNWLTTRPYVSPEFEAWLRRRLRRKP